MKTLLIAGSSKGGHGTSTAIANLADALQRLGYIVRVVDGDPVNRALTRMLPDAVSVDMRVPGAFNSVIESILTSPVDITLLDCSPNFNFAEYFNSISTGIVDLGLRIVVAPTISPFHYSVKNAATWIKRIGAGRYEYIVLTSQTSLIDDHLQGQLLLEVANNRIIEIPKYTDMMVENFYKHRSAPSGYLQGGTAAKALKLGSFHSRIWEDHIEKVVASAGKQAEWLTGMPIPRQITASDPKSPPEQ